MTDENEPEQSSDENENMGPMDGKKDENFEYPADYKEKFIRSVDLPISLMQTYELIGLDISKRYNYYFLNEKEILMAVGNTFQIFDIESKGRKIFFSSEIGGIGVITVHPTKKYFAVGECGNFPHIYIFKYEEGKVTLYRMLRKGTEQAYSALAFNDTGNYLASVGGEPDYNMVIWDWKTEAIILKAKAFSQEVYRVQFSSLFEEKSITSGMVSLYLLINT
ncbi:MAG: hypothetical protein MJ252_05010 [archaeon]|nr:hypothetical protein [archaeon]